MYFVELLETEVDEELRQEAADHLAYLYENLPLPEGITVRWVRGFRRKDDGFETFCCTFDVVGADTEHCRGTKGAQGWFGIRRPTTIFLRAEPDRYDDDNSVRFVVAHEAIHVMQFAQDRMGDEEDPEDLEREAGTLADFIEDAREEGLSVMEYLRRMQDYLDRSDPRAAKRQRRD